MKSKRIITRLSFVFMLVLALSIPSSLVAGNSGKACKLQGTWLWEFPYEDLGPGFVLKTWASYFGTGDNEGTDISEYINFPDIFPDFSISTTRGVWTKKGPNTYDFSILEFWVHRASGSVILVYRYSGTKTMIDCNTLESTVFVESLDPDTMEPLNEPYEGLSGTAHRVVLRESIP
ncbi:hypothetical protein EH220_04955 [bacterium]|nr:MAG: hypothetical protein EH220_04955 [bacterium]